MNPLPYRHLGPLKTSNAVGRIGHDLFATPTGQLLTPAGRQVELPKMRPQALALSADGKLLVTSGRAGKLVVTAATEQALAQAFAERDQLKSSVTNWAAAVAARDRRLAAVAVQLKTMAQERNNAATKFNELAGRHNRLVQDWNEVQARLAEKAKASPETKP